jgi:uncharacterized small protein (DUF1192 family)
VNVNGPMFDPKLPAATRIADAAKQLAGPGVTERFLINTMRIAVGNALTELDLELIRDRRTRISVTELRQRLATLQASVEALGATEASS